MALVEPAVCAYFGEGEDEEEGKDAREFDRGDVGGRHERDDEDAHDHQGGYGDQGFEEVLDGGDFSGAAGAHLMKLRGG